MKRNKLFILSTIVLAVLALWFLANSFSDKSTASEEKTQDVNYGGPQPGSVPGEGFTGPTEPHP